MTESPSPQNRITLSGLPAGGQTSHIQMDDKRMIIEHEAGGGYLCRLAEGQGAERVIPLCEGTTTVWHDDHDSRIDVVVASGGGIDIQGFKPPAASNRAFAAVQTGGAPPFKPGKGGFRPGFPFKPR